jgi:hypothetical protein
MIGELARKRAGWASTPPRSHPMNDNDNAYLEDWSQDDLENMIVRLLRRVYELEGIVARLETWSDV